MVTYANGDRCQYMDLLFLCRPREDGNAQPRVADDESLEVGWFAPDALPQSLATSTRSRLELVQRFKQNAAQGNSACLFARRARLAERAAQNFSLPFRFLQNSSKSSG